MLALALLALLVLAALDVSWLAAAWLVVPVLNVPWPATPGSSTSRPIPSRVVAANVKPAATMAATHIMASADRPLPRRAWPLPSRCPTTSPSVDCDAAAAHHAAADPSETPDAVLHGAGPRLGAP